MQRHYHLPKSGVLRHISWGWKLTHAQLSQALAVVFCGIFQFCQCHGRSPAQGGAEGCSSPRGWGSNCCTQKEEIQCLVGGLSPNRRLIFHNQRPLISHVWDTLLSNQISRSWIQLQRITALYLLCKYISSIKIQSKQNLKYLWDKK